MLVGARLLVWPPLFLTRLNMDTIKVQLNIRPLSHPSGIKNIKIREPIPGPNAITCDCGLNYAAFPQDPGEAFNAFKSSLQMAVRNHMKRNGLIKPLSGALEFELLIGVARPEYHFDSDGIKQNYQYRVPMKLPAFYKLLESTAKALYGVAFTDMKQIAKSSFSRVYRQKDLIEITITEVNPSDVDPDIKQLNLF